jgi:hypothetical protein
MEPAGMVHALEKIHQLLELDGRLIDIHPTGDPPPIKVRIGQQTMSVGWMKETDDFVEYGQASDALAQVVGRGLFTVEREGTFEFVTCADSVSEWHEYLAKEWKDAILDAAVAAKAEELLSMPGPDREMILCEQVRIARLKSAGRFTSLGC